MHMSARWILCILLIGGELWNRFLLRLAAKQRKKPLPEEVNDIYDAERWDSYLSICGEEHKVGLIRVLLSRAIDIILIFSPFFSWVDGLASDNFLLGLLLSGAIVSLLNLPIDYLTSLYDEFRIQKRYGQSNHTLGSFSRDYFVGELSSFVLTMGSFSILAIAFQAAVETSMCAGGGLGGALEAALTFVPVLFAVSIVFVLCGTAVEFALYKFRPLPSGELRTTVEHMLSSCKKRVRWLTVYNESAKSNEKNAFLLNIPGLRMISIADNALDDEDPGETLAVIAHEVGHLKHRFVPSDLLKYLSTITVIGLFLVLLSNASTLLSVDSWIQKSFSLENTSVFLSLQFLAYLFKPVSLLLDIPQNYAQRQSEYEADRNAVHEGYGAELAEMLKGSSREELVGINPHPFIELLEYSHPALPKRLRAIYEEMDKQGHIKASE